MPPDTARHCRRPELRQIARQSCRRQLTSQQHLVADHYAAQDLGIFAGDGNALPYLEGIGLLVAAEPDAHEHFHTVALGYFRYRAKALSLRVRAHAIETLRKNLQVGIDPFPADEGVRIQRTLARFTKWRIRHTRNTRRWRIRQGNGSTY
jgi:hypothetical protein